MSGMRALGLVLSLSVTGACASSPQFDRGTEPGGDDTPITVNVRVITQAELSVNASWTLLDALRNSLPGTKIQRPRGNDCPIVLLRGQDNVDPGRPSNPDVYVDGTHTNDTCPLMSLLAGQVRRVEIYPLGYSARAGYAGGPHGLILVFLRRGESSDTAQQAHTTS